MPFTPAVRYATYKSITDARVIVIYLPAEHLAHALEHMLATGANWRGKTVLLCDAALSSAALEPLTAAGASVATLAPIDGFDEQRFVVEGDARAVRAARLLVEDGRTRVVIIAPGTKDLFLAGLVFATSLFTPLAAAAIECLKGAGLETGVATHVAERLFEHSLRGYMKAGRKSWAVR